MSNITLRITNPIDSDQIIQDINIEKDKVKTSGFFNDCLLLSNDIIYFPPQFNDIVNLYLMCLNHDTVITNYVSKYPLVKNKNNIARLFQLCHYLDDNVLICDPISHLRNKFSEYKEIIDALHPDIQREIYLHLPYPLTPFTPNKDPTFFDAWIKNNKDKTIIVENIPYISYMVKPDAIVIGSSQYSTPNMKEFFTIKNGKKHGVHWIWYTIGTLGADDKLKACEEYYLDGNKDGSTKKWNWNGILQLEANYIQDTPHGSYVEYNEKGVKLRERNYNCGKLRNLIWYYENGSKREEVIYRENGDEITTYYNKNDEVQAIIKSFIMKDCRIKTRYGYKARNWNKKRNSLLLENY